MKALFSLLLIIVSICSLLGQNGFDRKWTRTFFVENIDQRGPEILTDSEGNVLVISIQTVFSTPGVTGFVLVKYDSQGNELWSRFYDNLLSSNFTAFTIDNNDNAYVAINYGFNAPGWKYDAILLKYAPDGELLWEINYGENFAYSSAVGRFETDGNGNLFLFGRAYDQINEVDHFYFVSCMDQEDGEEKWRTDQPGYIYAQNMKLTQGRLQIFATEYVVGGRNYIIQQFDPETGDSLHLVVNEDNAIYQPDFNYISDDGSTLIGNRGYSYSATKVNIEGDTVWHYSLPNLFGTSKYWVRSLTDDDSSNVYLTGGAQEATTWIDMVTTKLSSSGELLWQNFYYGVVDSIGDTGQGIRVDSQYVYAIGVRATEFEASDVVTLIYNKFSGELLFELIDTFGTTGIGYDIDFINDGFAFCGLTHENESHTTSIASGYYKLSQPVATSETEEKNTPFILYPNPAHNVIYVQQSKVAIDKSVAEIYSLNAQFLESHSISNNAPQAIETGHLPSGLYIMKVGNQAVKFVITK